MASKAPAPKSDEPRQPSPGLIARTIALNLLQEVTSKRHPLDEAIAASHAYREMAPRDRAFVRMLVASTLRRLGQIDELIKHCLERPLPRRAATVRSILRLGVAQIVVLETPAHAVVDTAVRLCARFHQPGQKGLVNAVLRRLAREGPALYAGQDAARLNTPNWLWESWTKAYGEETCRRIATAHLSEAPLDITARADPEIWARRLDALRLDTDTLRLGDTPDITALPGYTEGAWWVQDAAASLPARVLLAALENGVEDRTVADLCAAPGGKTAQLAAAGAHVIAVDRSKKRIGTLRENFERLRLTADVVAADATRWQPNTPLDAILLDAPCSATGTIRRHPDIPGNKSPKEIARLVDIQNRLIAAAAALLQPGGTLVYSVCSLQPEEGPAVVEGLLASRDDVIRLPVTVDETGAPPDSITPDGDIRTLPCHLSEVGGMDGFYIARLRRAGR